MILIGFLLVGVAVAAAVILVVQNAADAKMHAFGWHWEIPGYWLAVAGLVIMAVFVVGLMAWRVGAARARRIRREHRQLTREHQRLTEQAQNPPAQGPAGGAPAAPPQSAPGYPPANQP